MLLGDVPLALRSSLTQLKASFLGVLELALASLFLTLEVFRQIHDSQLCCACAAEPQPPLTAAFSDRER